MGKRTRANGTGCVYARKRKDGSVRGYWIKFYVDGDQRIVNAETTDRDEANEKLARLLGDKAKGVPIPRKQLTLGEAVDNAKRTAEMNGRKPTYDIYEKRLIPFFGRGAKMTAITHGADQAIHGAPLKGRRRISDRQPRS